jgi:cytoskeletal protein RodZ
MNKGYAFGFLLVVLIVVLGLYVAFTGFMASREAQQAQAEPEQATSEAQAGAAPALTAAPTNPPAEASATVLTLPTPVPGLTATLTAMAQATDEPAAEATERPESTAPPPTEAPAAAPSDTPTPQAAPPTPVSIPAYQFRLAGPPSPDPNYPACCYIYGTIRDASNNALEGVQVQASTTWTAPVVTTSKGGVDLGKYDIPIGRDAVTWTVFLVDAAGNQISSQVQIQFDPDAGNAYRVDWQRTY